MIVVINICPHCLGFVVLFLNYHLVVVFFWEEIIQSKIWVPIVWVALCDEKNWLTIGWAYFWG